MNNLYTPALRAARFLLPVFVLLTSFSLSAQPPGGNSSSIVIFEDVVFLQAPTTSSTEATSYAAVDDNYTTEPTTTVSFNNSKDLTSFKSVQNSANIYSASGWETPQNQATNEWQAESINVTAYPNPVVDYLQIELTDFDNELQLVELIGANGQLLKRQNTPALSQVQIDMSSLPNGSYYIRTTTLRGVTTLPIAK